MPSAACLINLEVVLRLYGGSEVMCVDGDPRITSGRMHELGAGLPWCTRSSSFLGPMRLTLNAQGEDLAHSATALPSDGNGPRWPLPLSTPQ